MNKQMIRRALDNTMDAITALKDAIAADTSVTLDLELSAEEARVLNEIARLDITIPTQVHQINPSISVEQVEKLLYKLNGAAKR